MGVDVVPELSQQDFIRVIVGIGLLVGYLKEEPRLYSQRWRADRRSYR
jgi:hypothetical protein